MLQTKIDCHKESGTQYKHLIQSFADYDNITPEIAYNIGKKFMTHPKFDGFQVLMAVHKDRQHIHIHYCINSVSDDTGKKWNQTKQDLYRLREYSDELCRGNNLVVIPDNHSGKSVSDGEYRNTIKGKSWKHELWLAVNECMKYSTCREDFIANLQRIGYQVSWKDDRKYITFTTPDGKKCRNNKLYPPEKYTKETMEQIFALNQRYSIHDQMKGNFELLIGAIFLLSQNEDDTLRKYPLSHLEGEALLEYAVEQTKGKGIDAAKEQER